MGVIGVCMYDVAISELVRLRSWQILCLEAYSTFQVNSKNSSYVCFSLSSPYTDGKCKILMTPVHLVHLRKTKFKSVGGDETMATLG